MLSYLNDAKLALKRLNTLIRNCNIDKDVVQIKVARVVNLKLVFTDYFLYNLIVLIK